MKPESFKFHFISISSTSMYKILNISFLVTINSIIQLLKQFLLKVLNKHLILQFLLFSLTEKRKLMISKRYRLKSKRNFRILIAFQCKVVCLWKLNFAKMHFSLKLIKFLLSVGPTCTKSFMTDQMTLSICLVNRSVVMNPHLKSLNTLKVVSSSNLLELLMTSVLINKKYLFLIVLVQLPLL